jgi:aryl-alcohol dehydrogenase-like predicted oxidoreductase
MAADEAFRRRTLGKGGAAVAPIGVGTNKWSKGSNDESVLEAYRAFRGAGGDLVDTAEVYGFGKSERLVGACVEGDPGPVHLVSKFAPFLGRNQPKHLRGALDASLARLGVGQVSLYLIHFPFPFTDFEALADELAAAVASGKVRHVGVSNFNARSMHQMAERLGKHGIALAANEVNYSLLNRRPETSGVLDACRQLDCALIAYFPLAAGRLTRDAAGAKPARLREVLAATAKAHDASVSQVALNWLLCRDEHVIPIPGASRGRNAQDNLAALGWRLTDEEFAAIDRASAAS